MIPDTRPRSTVFARTAVSLTAFIASLLFLLVFEQTEASAQACVNTNCAIVNIYNCTPINFTLRLRLCCGGAVVISPPVAAPAVPCPGISATVNVAPCTVIGIAGIFPAPPPGVTVVFDPIFCRIRIF